jgi:Sulfotransferase family
MDAEELVAEALAHTGLDDFGGDELLEGLEVLAQGIDGEAQLNDFGAVALRTQIVGALANRLRIVDYASRNPSVADEPVDRPLIVVGMFRAGTTLLSQLLDKDPNNRALLSWEVADSVPPPAPAQFRSGPRVDAVRAGQEFLSQVNPALDAVHHEQADQATECLAVLGQDFKSLIWEAVAIVPTYSAWLDTANHLSAYRHHRRVLQVLQHGGVRGRWTLKSPHHALALEALTTVYPNSRLVLLHRDPTVLCASVCSLIRTLSSTFTDADHRAWIAYRWPAVLAQSVDRVAAFRAAHPDHPVIDVQYADLVRDPIATVAGIYQRAGQSLDNSTASAMSAFLAANPKDKYGVHRYDLAEFNLDANDIRERFADYIDRYDVPDETLERST